MSQSPLGIVTLGMLGGSRTYLAGGANLDLIGSSAGIDIELSEQIDQASAGIDIDLEPAGTELEVTNDGNGIDLQG